ncbi:S8 family serine peptidase [Umezawaea endophytica]|uniref:S8 family serine peptidase n=1 Tax=Umezawaea endophytica TaxID=1654476 RepID=A0A9X2VV34_9PSEU|nr:S8 family serine peptidase [Umezawaea endophytica]MCS7482752.1 S8 family serine peptidase [Umezawaea endophytica]
MGVTALTLGLVVGSAGESAAEGSAPPRFTAPGAAGSVTLITGDRVVLDGAGGGSVVPGTGRDDIAYSTSTEQGHLFVVPDDARKAVASGRVDRRLFDVTELVESRYDDAHRDSVPLILTTDGGVRAADALAGTTVTYDLPVVKSFSANTSKAKAADTWRTLVGDSSYTKIRLDGLRQPTLDRSVAQIGAPAAWQAGYTGTGVKVAVLDTGVDAEHPDLKGKELAAKNFTYESDADLSGHGTHVAATVASAGAKYRGVAPDAKILDGKVCVRFGCAESWILGGMAWAVEQGADVVNLSLGGGDSPEIDPLEEAVNTLSAQHGTLFVIAAGNSGSDAETIGSPGSADAALTVGAVDRNDDIAAFSSRGPRVGDGAVKPDVTAPGVDIVAARSSTGSIGTPVGDGYVSMSGTSMATPHVAGAAALLKQQHPDWTGSRIKAALVASAKPNPALTAFDQGTGRIDLTRAITQTVTAEPANLSLGLQQWPHADDVPVTKDVVYRNSGTDTVTLDLTVDAKGPDGKPAPAGLLTVAPANVTVPAGGEAKVTVTGDTRIGTLDGAFTGTVIATSSTGAVRSPVSVAREVESYTVTVNHTDLDGTRAPGETYLGEIGGSQTYYLSEDDGSAQIRVPKGDYYAWSTIVTGKRFAFLAAPRLTVDEDTVVDADARITKPVKVSVPEPTAVIRISDVGATWPTATGTVIHGKALPDTYEPSTGQIGEDAAPDRMASRVGVQWQGTPVGDMPINYRFASAWKGEMPTGVVRDLGKSDFAEVKTTVGPSPDGRDHFLTLSPADSLGGGTFAWRAPVGASGTATDYVAGDGVTWTSTHEQIFENTIEAEQNTPPREFRAGKRYANLPGYAVFGPALDGFAYALGRTGSTLRVTVPVFGDSTGGTGYSAFDSARTTLFRDGVKIGESTEPGNLRGDMSSLSASYRVETEATRSGVSEFSTKVTAAWTFRSEEVGPRYTPLPMSIIRFRPDLDRRNTAPANRTFPVPLVVQQNPGADNGRVNRITVDVSFDDGKTWRHAPVIGRSALVHNGPAGSFASLRAKATDSKGNTVENTVIRAYKIAG